MKKTRALSVFTNIFLALIVLAVGTVCFLPAASPAFEVDERARYRGSMEDGVTLMFNVYWGTEEVYAILDVLDEFAATATFFLGGSWADDNVPCVKEISARGHEIGSHGYFHRDHSKLDYVQNVEEIRTSVDFLSLACGKEVQLFAPPSGAYNSHTLDAAEELGLITVMWSRDTIDWRDKDEQVCYSRATEGITGGELVLMHPMPHTLAALPKILQTYADRGLRTVSAGENLGAFKGE